jgi:cytochrome c-type biogenesis protein CcmE
MYGKKVKLRLVFLTLILASLILTVFLVLQSLKENGVYFQSQSEIKSLIETPQSNTESNNPKIKE